MWKTYLQQQTTTNNNKQHSNNRGLGTYTSTQVVQGVVGSVDSEHRLHVGVNYEVAARYVHLSTLCSEGVRNKTIINS
jgi:hypothetical protein